MPDFSIIGIREDELKGIQLLEADKAADEEAIRKINLLLEMVKAARKDIAETEVKNPYNFLQNIKRELDAREEEREKLRPLLKRLGEELQAADADIDKERSQIEQLKRISNAAVSIMDRLSTEEDRLSKHPLVGINIIKRIKAMNDADRKRLRIKSNVFSLLFYYLNSVKTKISGIVDSVEYHAKSALRYYENVLARPDHPDPMVAEAMRQLHSYTEKEEWRKRQIANMAVQLSNAEKILKEIEGKLELVKDLLIIFREYLNEVIADSVNALNLEIRLIGIMKKMSRGMVNT